MRGYIFELCGKKIFAFGGASSHDIKDGILEPDDFKTKSDCMNEFRKRYEQGQMVRINHISWWKDELPTQEELNFGLKTLSENDNSVDFIISHCCPQSVVSVFSNGMYKSDRLTQYFNKIADIVSFDKWYFGHYHDNTSIMNKYVLLYEQIVRVV